MSCDGEEDVGGGAASSVSAPAYRPPPFVEVWSVDGSVRRFAAGTKARFAIERINSKVGDPSRRVEMIESIKAGEQTVEFGPDAELVSYGKGWRLRAVSATPASGKFEASKIEQSVSREINFADFYPGGKLPNSSPPRSGGIYVLNVSVVFGLLFALAAFWVYLLEAKFFVT